MMRSRCRALFLLLSLTLPTLIAKTSSGWTNATTSANTAQSKVEIRGVTGYAVHSHGGAPASLGQASFVFANRGDRSRRVSVVDIEFLRGRDCEHSPRTVVSHPKSSGILLAGGTQQRSAPKVELAAGVTVNGTVGFAAVSAYYLYCDRFAFRVHFQVDDEKVAVIDEVNITRREPLRRHNEPDGSP